MDVRTNMLKQLAYACPLSSEYFTFLLSSLSKLCPCIPPPTPTDIPSSFSEKIGGSLTSLELLLRGI